VLQFHLFNLGSWEVNIIYYFIADSKWNFLKFIDACENPDGKGF